MNDAEHNVEQTAEECTGIYGHCPVAARPIRSWMNNERQYRTQ